MNNTFIPKESIFQSEVIRNYTTEVFKNLDTGVDENDDDVTG